MLEKVLLSEELAQIILSFESGNFRFATTIVNQHKKIDNIAIKIKQQLKILLYNIFFEVMLSINKAIPLNNTNGE